MMHRKQQPLENRKRKRRSAATKQYNASNVAHIAQASVHATHSRVESFLMAFAAMFAHITIPAELAKNILLIIADAFVDHKLDTRFFDRQTLLMSCISDLCKLSNGDHVIAKVIQQCPANDWIPALARELLCHQARLTYGLNVIELSQPRFWKSDFNGFDGIPSEVIFETLRRNRCINENGVLSIPMSETTFLYSDKEHLDLAQEVTDNLWQCARSKTPITKQAFMSGVSAHMPEFNAQALQFWRQLAYKNNTIAFPSDQKLADVFRDNPSLRDCETLFSRLLCHLREQQIQSTRFVANDFSVGIFKMLKDAEFLNELGQPRRGLSTPIIVLPKAWAPHRQILQDQLTARLSVTDLLRGSSGYEELLLALTAHMRKEGVDDGLPFQQIVQLLLQICKATPSLEVTHALLARPVREWSQILDWVIVHQKLSAFQDDADLPQLIAMLKEVEI